MEDKLIEILETFGYPVNLQGSLDENEQYPDSFFTFWENSTEGTAHYDNQANSEIYDYDVNFYSNEQELVYSKLKEAIRKLRENGFIISGSGYSVASDEVTHTGRGIHVLYRKKNGGK